MKRMWGLALLLTLPALVKGPELEASALLPTVLNVVFVDQCDGLDLRIRDRLGVFGTHTGCGGGERVFGETFVDGDGESGVAVTYFDRLQFKFLDIELYRTGFRAGKYYVYETRTGRLQRFGDFVPAPVAP